MHTQSLESYMLLACILSLSAAGAWFSGQLLKLHDRIWTFTSTGEDNLFSRMCQGTGSNCTGAVKGAWSRIRVFIPRPHRDFTVSLKVIALPVAFLGLAYFVAIGVWFVFVGSPRPIGAGWHHLVLAVAFGAGAVSRFYLGLMALRRAPWCLGCAVVHVINFLLLAAISQLSAAEPKPDSIAAAMSSPEQVIAMTLAPREATGVITFALIIIAGLFAFRRAHLIMAQHMSQMQPYKAQLTSLQENPQFLLREFLALPQQHIPPHPGELAVDGELPLDVFTGFECPSCYCKWVTLESQIADTFSRRIRVRIRHYPLCSECNNAVQGRKHPNACQAAYAVEAAKLQGGETAFKQMHDLLFAHRQTLGPQTYPRLAMQMALDPDRLLRDMQGDAVRRIIAFDVALAKELNVTGTPTVFLDGRQITELIQTSMFFQTIGQTYLAARARKHDPHITDFRGNVLHHPNILSTG